MKHILRLKIEISNRALTGLAATLFVVVAHLILSLYPLIPTPQGPSGSIYEAYVFPLLKRYHLAAWLLLILSFLLIYLWIRLYIETTGRDFFSWAFWDRKLSLLFVTVFPAAYVAAVIHIVFAIENCNLQHVVVCPHLPVSQYLTQWPGPVVGIATTIYLSILVTVLPNRLQTQLSKIMEGLQAPLTDMRGIADAALEMIAQADSKSGKVLVISGAAVLGLELESDRRIQWLETIRGKALIGVDIRILCWDWRHQTNLLLSPLGRLCQSIAKGADGRQPGKSLYVYQLLETSLRSYLDLLSVSQLIKNVRIGLIDEPPFGLVYVEASPGRREVLIFFGTLGSITDGGIVWGYRTIDSNWVGLAKSVFESSALRGRTVIDSRTEEQRQRDDLMLSHFGNQNGPEEVQIDKYRVTVDPGVFPSQLGAMTADLILAIRKSIKDWRARQLGPVKLAAIDFGTGNGILALVLAEDADEIIATDTCALATENARKNADRHGRTNIRCINTANFMRPLEELTTYDCIFAVFNFPQFESPLELYSVGGLGGGAGLVKSFLERMRRALILPKIRFLLPELRIGRSNSITEIADELGYKYRIVVAEPKGGRGRIYELWWEPRIQPTLSASVDSQTPQ